MPITETVTQQTTLIRSEDSTHRYLLSKLWDTTKPQALLIMLCAGTADTVNVDTTTMLVMKNLKALDYGGVSICNLFSTPDKETDEENDRIILTEAMKTETIIFAWGTGSMTSPLTQGRIAAVVELLKPYRKQTYCIAAPNGKAGLHPLAPALRESWTLVPWDAPREKKSDDDTHQENKKTSTQRTKKAVSPA